MPEGPEVTIIAKQLHAVLHNKYLIHIHILDGAYSSSKTTQYKISRTRITNLNKKPGPIKFESVGKHGKFIYFTLLHNNHDRFVIGNTLGLTGSWYISEPEGQKIYPKIAIEFADSRTGPTRKVVFSDKLGMGKVWIESQTWLKTKLSELGPDILDPGFTLDRFMQLTSSKPVYMAIVDQDFIAGVGNYLRSEIIGTAAIDPWQLWSKMPADQKQKLYIAITQIARDVETHGGVSDEERVSYRDIFGVAGRYVVKYYKCTTSPDGKSIKSFKDSAGRMFYYVS